MDFAGLPRAKRTAAFLARDEFDAYVALQSALYAPADRVAINVDVPGFASRDHAALNFPELGCPKNSAARKLVALNTPDVGLVRDYLIASQQFSFDLVVWYPRPAPFPRKRFTRVVAALNSDVNLELDLPVAEDAGRSYVVYDAPTATHQVYKDLLSPSLLSLSLPSLPSQQVAPSGDAALNVISSYNAKNSLYTPPAPPSSNRALWQAFMAFGVTPYRYSGDVDERVLQEIANIEKIKNSVTDRFEFDYDGYLSKLLLYAAVPAETAPGAAGGAAAPSPPRNMLLWYGLVILVVIVLLYLFYRKARSWAGVGSTVRDLKTTGA